MIKNIDNPTNKNKIAIVAVGYNRIKATSRLLNSLNNAYYDIEDVPLILSVDASGDQELYDYVNQFEWKHGTKYVNIQEERLGLKSHIFQCFSLTKYFRGVIILEDDIFVSPYFYHYANATLEKYGDDEKVAGIALYTNETNGFVGLPFQPVYGGSDVFALQAVCSWGEMMNERMWNNFKVWLEGWNDNFEPIDMIDRIKKWSRAWSKFVYAYMLTTDTYFIYPYMPVTTNFNDAGGEHGGGDSSTVQVSLLQGKKNYQLEDFSQLVCYDVYCHNKSLPQWLGLKSNEVDVDYYGQRSHYSCRYVLAPFSLPYKRVRGFRLVMRPWELNIKYNIEGNDIILYDRETTQISPAPVRAFSYNYLMYYLRRFRSNITIKLLVRDYLIRLKNKVS